MEDTSVTPRVRPKPRGINRSSPHIPREPRRTEYPRSERVLRGASEASLWVAAIRRPGRLNLSAHALPVLAAGFEFVLIAAAAFQAGALYHKVAFGYLPSATFYFAATLCLAGMFVVRCGFARDYSLKRLLDPREQLRLVFMHWNSAYAAFVLALFMIHATDFYSRASIVVQYAAGLAVATFVRLLMTRAVAQGLGSGRLHGKKVAVIGEAGLVHETVRRLCRAEQGVDVVGVVALTSSAASEGPASASARAQETRAALQTVQNIGRRTALDDVVINLPWSDDERIRAFVEGLAAVPAAVHLAPDQLWAWAGNPIPSRVGRMRTVRLARAPLTLKDRILKRAFDIFAASALLVVASPLLAAIAICIKLDSPGPIVFRQRRNGFNQHEFRVLKFRTMRTLDDGRVIPQATPDDHRVTRVGRLLRSTNLDELPQLLNVIAGEMSLVGPRPHAVAHNNAYEEKIRLYARRHNVKPGITGWAQVNGYRGQTDSIGKMRQRVEHDLFYIDHWSLMFDIKILLMTILSPRSYRNAY
jgi:Undecaprenyl-phosphate glucose phosphotransferase